MVPGSHRFGASPRQAVPDPAAAHPGEVRLIAEAGTVVIFNSHVWHGGTRNRSDRPRRVQTLRQALVQFMMVWQR